MSPWSPLRWTTPLAPRAAPGNCSRSPERLPLAGERVSCSLFKLEIASRTRDRRSRGYRGAPDLLEPRERDGDRRAGRGQIDAQRRSRRPRISTAYVPMGMSVSWNFPCASVFACKVRLAPRTVTAAPAAGPAAVEAGPESVAAAWASAAPAARRKTSRHADAQCVARRRTPTKIPFLTKLPDEATADDARVFR